MKSQVATYLLSRISPPEVPEMLPPLTISFKQAAQMLNVSASSVRRQAALGQVSTIRVGRRRMVVMDSLREWVRAQQAR